MIRACVCGDRDRYLRRLAGFRESKSDETHGIEWLARQAQSHETLSPFYQSRRGSGGGTIER